MCRRFVVALEHDELTASRWIVEEDQIRIRRSDEKEE